MYPRTVPRKRFVPRPVVPSFNSSQSTNSFCYAQMLLDMDSDASAGVGSFPSFQYCCNSTNVILVLISLDYVQESVPSNESITNLIIAQDELKTIQALSNRQNSETRQWSADFIEGKGSGQIILLHGISSLIESSLFLQS